MNYTTWHRQHVYLAHQQTSKRRWNELHDMASPTSLLSAPADLQAAVKWTTRHAMHVASSATNRNGWRQCSEATIWALVYLRGIGIRIRIRNVFIRSLQKVYRAYKVTMKRFWIRGPLLRPACSLTQGPRIRRLNFTRIKHIINFYIQFCIIVCRMSETNCHIDCAKQTQFLHVELLVKTVQLHT